MSVDGEPSGLSGRFFIGGCVGIAVERRDALC